MIADECEFARCTEMCHSQELLKRIESYRIDDFELISNIFGKENTFSATPTTPFGDSGQQKKTRSESALAIKIYYRSSADKDMSVPETVRPPFILFATIEYMLSRVADCEFGDVMTKYSFIANRLRSIRQDFAVLFSKNANFRSLKRTIQSFELMVLTYLVFLNSLRTDSKHDEKTLLDHFSESLNILIECYTHQHSHRKTLGPLAGPLDELCFESPRKCDFLAMDLVLHLFINSTGYIRRLSQFSKLVSGFFTHPSTLMVLRIQNALETHHYQRYFRIMLRKDFVWHSFLGFFEFLFRVRLRIYSTSGLIKDKAAVSRGQKARALMQSLKIEKGQELVHLMRFLEDVDEKLMKEFGYDQQKDILYRNHMVDIKNEKTKLKMFASPLIRAKEGETSKWALVRQFLDESMLPSIALQVCGDDWGQFFSQSKRIEQELQKIELIDKNDTANRQIQETEKAKSQIQKSKIEGVSETDGKKAEQMPKQRIQAPKSANLSASLPKKPEIIQNTQQKIEKKEGLGLFARSGIVTGNENTKEKPAFKMGPEAKQNIPISNDNLFSDKNKPPKNKQSFSNEDFIKPRLGDVFSQPNQNPISEKNPKNSLFPNESEKIKEMKGLFFDTKFQQTPVPDLPKKVTNPSELKPNQPAQLPVASGLDIEPGEVASQINISLQNQLHSGPSDRQPISEMPGFNPIGLQLGSNPQLPGLLEQPSLGFSNNLLEINNSAPPQVSKPSLTAADHKNSKKAKASPFMASITKKK